MSASVPSRQVDDHWLSSPGNEANDMAQYIQRRFSKGEIDRAGKALIPWWKLEADAPENLGDLYAIVENWRTCHALPLLTFRMVLQGRAKRVESRPIPIIAQRLKRFSSTMNKLVREPTMKLSQMQDLGGCRAILSSVEAVEQLYQRYRESPNLFGTELKCNDYIRNPKPDGYRGIHVVGRYNPRSQKNEPWKGQRIEIQLRSQLQHVFATAVETVTTFTREPLKFGAGPGEWRRFFSLVGTAFAIRENTPIVEGTPTNHNEMTRELRELTNSLKVRQRLRAWTSAIKQPPTQNTKNAKWLLLVLDLNANTINVVGYRDRRKASRDLATIEREQSSRSSGLDAVLVWVGSVRDLRRAYPNYYADTRAFLEALNVALR